MMSLTEVIASVGEEGLTWRERTIMGVKNVCGRVGFEQQSTASSRHLERHLQPCGSQSGRGSTEWPLVDAD